LLACGDNSPLIILNGFHLYSYIGYTHILFLDTKSHSLVSEQ
jgi:hypothetical protein